MNTGTFFAPHSFPFFSFPSPPLPSSPTLLNAIVARNSADSVFTITYSGRPIAQEMKRPKYYSVTHVRHSTRTTVTFECFLNTVSFFLFFFSIIITNKKVQQSWQTSALAVHLLLARLVSMPIIFCLLPSSSLVILVFYLFSTGISEQHVWELWV